MYATGYAEFIEAEDYIKNLKIDNKENENKDTQEYKNNIKKINQVAEINKKIYSCLGKSLNDIDDEDEKNIKEIYEIGRAWSLEYFESLYKMLGTKFDKYIFESEAAPIGLDIVMKNLETIFEIGEEGAIIFDGEKELSANGKKLHKRVFVNKNGLPTYEAKDLGNMEIKLSYAKENNFDIYKNIVITANETNEYFKVIFCAIEKLRPELAGTMLHYGHGMMKFADGKMSSRKGNIVAGDELIENIKDKLSEKFIESRVEDIENKKDLIEKVAIASIKYAVLRQAIGRDVIFDMDKVINVEGDSGPYLQYTHARFCAVAKDKNEIKNENEEAENNFKININVENKNLILTIEKYEDVLVEVISEMSPHRLVTYLTELARNANAWYAHNRVAGNAENEFIAFRAKEILAHGLKVLAMHAPERM